MTATTEPTTAIIYAFPLRGRFAADRFGTASLPGRPAPATGSVMIIDEAWYHQAAIADDHDGPEFTHRN